MVNQVCTLNNKLNIKLVINQLSKSYLLLNIPHVRFISFIKILNFNSNVIPYVQNYITIRFGSTL